MASSCALGGVSNVKLLATYQDFKKANCSKWKIDSQRCCQLKATNGPSVICFGKKPANFICLVSLVSQPKKCASRPAVSCSSQTKTQPEDASEVKKFTGTNNLISSSEVQSLVSSICDTTSIAEFKLNLGGFRLYVKRDVSGHNSTASVPYVTTPVQVDTLNEIPNLNGSASTSVAIYKPETSKVEIQRTIDVNLDEGLVMLQSPKVGVFRRCRVIKGKRAPPPCKEKQEVKEGQVLCYVEQLGGEIPVESDVSGEVVKILRADGEPVGYGDALIAILPSFPGIKKLQLPG